MNPPTLATSIGRAPSVARRAWVAAVLAGLLAACGSSAGATQGPGTSNGSGSGAAATPAAVATADVGGGGGTSGGGGGANLDVEAVANALIPPNSTEITKTTATDTWFAMYETTDSIDSLKTFYEAAIPRTGLQILSTTSLQGGISWVIAADDSGSFGGAVNVFPSGDGKNSVQVTVGKT